MNVKNDASLAHDGDHLLILTNTDDACIQFVTPIIPKKYQLKIDYCRAINKFHAHLA